LLYVNEIFAIRQPCKTITRLNGVQFLNKYIGLYERASEVEWSAQGLRAQPLSFVKTESVTPLPSGIRKNRVKVATKSIGNKNAETLWERAWDSML